MEGIAKRVKAVAGQRIDSTSLLVMSQGFSKHKTEENCMLEIISVPF